MRARNTIACISEGRFLAKKRSSHSCAATFLLNQQTWSLNVRSFVQTASPPKTPLRIVLIGAPGSGKGTQATSLAKDFAVVPVSTGHLLRTAIAEKKPIAKQIEPVMKSGGLVSDAIVLELIKEVLAKESVSKHGWVFDGYPRTEAQAKQLTRLLTALTQPITFVFYLKINEDIIYERIKDRWVHLPSGRDYNTVYKPPKVPGKDDITGEPLVKRADDTLESIRARLKAYSDITLPILKLYKDAGLLVEVEAPTSAVAYRSIHKHVTDHILNTAN